MEFKGDTIKPFLKNLLNCLSLIAAFPLYLGYVLSSASGNKDPSFWAFSQFMSLLPGIPGNYLRKGFYRLSMVLCDKDCVICFGTIFSQVDTEIGRGVYIGPNCNIGKCEIQDDCSIGSNVHIMSGKYQHEFDDISLSIKEQGGTFEKIVIGEDTWIGNCALIMANVGRKCIVGAGSVVTKDVEDFSIVAGNPARVIKKRM